MVLTDIEVQALIDSVSLLSTKAPTCTLEELEVIFPNLKPKHVERFVQKQVDQ